MAKYYVKTSDGSVQLPTLKTYNNLTVLDTADIKTLNVTNESTLNTVTATSVDTETLKLGGKEFTKKCVHQFSVLFHYVKSSGDEMDSYWQITAYIPSDYEFATHKGDEPLVSFTELTEYLTATNSRAYVRAHSDLQFFNGLVEIYGQNGELYCGVTTTAITNTPGFATWTEAWIDSGIGLTLDIVDEHSTFRDYITELY